MYTNENQEPKGAFYKVDSIKEATNKHGNIPNLWYSTETISYSYFTQYSLFYNAHILYMSKYFNAYILKRIKYFNLISTNINTKC